MTTKEEAIKKMLTALPYMRHAMAEAAKNGSPHIGILSVKPDGSGRVEAKFEAPEFFKDLAVILDAPAQTEEDNLNAGALSILDRFGIRRDGVDG